MASEPVTIKVIPIGIAIFNILPFAWTFLKGFLSTGRKGSMLTRREVLHENTDLAEAISIYRDRLIYEGFDVFEQEAPNVLHGLRSSGKAGATIGQTHANKPLDILIEFAQQGSDVLAQFEMRMKDFVILDTGEGKYIDQTLDRIIGSDLEEEEKPVVPDETFKATVAFQMSILMLIAVPLMFFPGFSVSTYAEFTMLLVMQCAICIILAGIGLFECFVKPKELTGKGKALAAIVLSITATSLGAVVFLVLHGAEFWNEINLD